MKRTLRRHRGFSARPLLALVLAAGTVAVIAAPAVAGPKQPRSGKGGPSGTSTTTTTTTTTTDASGVQTFEGEKTPATPTELAVQPLTGGGFKVVWKDNATNETGYEVERSPAFAGGAALLGPDSSGFVDQQDQASVEYRVRARGVTLQSSWTTWAQGQSATSSFVILPPGSGFSGATPQPAAVGSAEMPGYDAKAIARWDVVPYQTFTGNFHIGVVAFHMNGIDRVEFSANGGPWKAVTEMQLNPLTNVWEYTAMLRAADFADGPVEVRAVVYPKDAGEVRVLESLGVYANSRSTLPAPELFVDGATGDDTAGNGTISAPFRSIRQALARIASALPANDGATITLLSPGQYDIDSPPSVIANSRWVTIRSAPDSNRSAFVIAPQVRELVRPKTGRLRFENLSLDFSLILQMYKEDIHQQWYDNCRWFQSDGWAATYANQLTPVRNEGNYSGLYVTNSIAQDTLYGFVRANLVRSCTVERISGDCFQNSVVVISCRAKTVDDTILEHHADVLQYFGYHENIVVYGVTAEDLHATQNIFLDHYQSSFTDCAFVNIAVQNQQGSVPVSQLNSVNKHVLFFHISNPGQGWVFRDDFLPPKQFAATNVVFRNCVLQSVARGKYEWAGLPVGVEMSNCHLVADDPTGFSPTFGQVVVEFSAPGRFIHAGMGAVELLGSGYLIPGLPAAAGRNRGAWCNP